jgi:biopolymer transport protein ExbD
MAEASNGNGNGNGEQDVVHYEPPRKSRGHGRVRIQPPLTPMIDVTFQLLLFFLLTFQFRQREGQIPGSLPQQGQGGVSEKTDLEMPIRISLRPMDAAGTRVVFEVEGHPHAIESPKELGRVLLRRARSTPNGTDVPVIINSRDDVQWRWVVEVFNQSVRAKFKNVGFATALAQT